MRLPFRVLLYALLIAAIFIPWLAWETDANQVRRWVYPAKAKLVAASTQCSAGAPDWLGPLARDMAQRHDSPANQLAWVTAGGAVHGCVNGWEATPWVSPRLGADTPMRLASLSKIVSFIGLVGVDEAARPPWLDAPLAGVLALAPPYADARVADIRVRDLLNHSAGFDRIKTTDPITRMGHRPWCPYDLDELARTRLDFAPGTRFAYHNLDYCLAAAAYEKRFGRSLWAVLEQDFRLRDYGLDWLDRRDTPVRYNLMHEGLTSPSHNFVQKLDWLAARAPFGLTGNAVGLARFVHDNRPLLAVAQGLRDDSMACNEKVQASCFDGFLNRIELDGHTLWQQGGYLYGMSALFALDEAGNFIVWLGAGEGRPLSAAAQHIRQVLVQNRRGGG